jgi:hypothetical protein
MHTCQLTARCISTKRRKQSLRASVVNRKRGMGSVRLMVFNVETATDADADSRASADLRTQRRAASASRASALRVACCTSGVALHVARLVACCEAGPHPHDTTWMASAERPAPLRDGTGNTSPRGNCGLALKLQGNQPMNGRQCEPNERMAKGDGVTARRPAGASGCLPMVAGAAKRGDRSGPAAHDMRHHTDLQIY